MDDSFSNSFVLCTENLNLHQLVKNFATLISRKSPTCNFVVSKLFQQLKQGQKHKKFTQNKKLTLFDQTETKLAHLNYSPIKQQLWSFPINICFLWPSKALHKKVTVKRGEKNSCEKISVLTLFAQLIKHIFIYYLHNRGSKADMVSGVIRMLICKTHKSWENQPQQQRRLCRQILLPRPRRLRPRDPWAMQLKLQQTGVGAGESPAP